MVWSESRIVRQRHAQKAKQDAITMQTAMLSVLSKKGGELFKDLVEKFDDGY